MLLHLTREHLLAHQPDKACTKGAAMQTEWYTLDCLRIGCVVLGWHCCFSFTALTSHVCRGVFHFRVQKHLP